MKNLNNFRDFYKGKLTELEEKISEISEEKANVDEFLDQRNKELNDFGLTDNYSKENIVRRIQSDMNNLKVKKQNILSLFKEYQKKIGDSDKIKRYFQRAMLNLKENKAYDLIRMMEKLHHQLENKYNSINMQEYLDTIILELDEYALLNSRNMAPRTTKEIYIACFKSKKVLGYNVTTNNLSIAEANFQGTDINMFLNFSRSININGTLYINGGWDEINKKALKYHLSYDTANKEVIKEPDMIYGHSAHSLLFVPPTFLYVISGSGTSKCEKYDINSKIFEEIAEINYHRQNASLFYHNEQYLYAFGGLCWDDSKNDFVFVESVERLDIGFGPSTEEEYRWEIVPALKAKDNVVISKSVMTVVPITSNKILLVGGMYKDHSYSDDVVLFDFEKFEFSNLDDLKLEKKTCFPNKYFLFFGDYAYQFDNEGDIHEFSAKDLSFKVVNHHKPFTI